MKKTDVETDYPYLTKDIAVKLSRNQNFITATVASLGLKEDPAYHQPIRASQTTHIHRYSQSAFDKISEHLRTNADFNPYKARKKGN